MYKLYYKTTISCAHSLKETLSLTTKKCLHPHGHNFGISVIIQVERITDGMIIDFGKLKEVIDKYDHRDLNEIMENPTSEELAFLIWRDIKTIMQQWCILKVTVQESEKGKVSYED